MACCAVISSGTHTRRLDCFTFNRAASTSTDSLCVTLKLQLAQKSSSHPFGSGSCQCTEPLQAAKALQEGLLLLLGARQLLAPMQA